MGPTRREPERTCVACRGRRARPELIRVVRDPAGRARFDLDGRLPGRGAWVCATAACVDALAPAALSRTLRGPAALAPPAERRAEIAGALGRRLAGLVQVARKARAVVFGAAGVKAALGGGRAGLVLLDGGLGADAVAAWRVRAAAVPVAVLPPGADLGELAGRGPATVAALAPGGLAEAAERVVARWRAFSAEPWHNKES